MAERVLATQETVRLFFGSAVVVALALAHSGCAAEQRPESVWPVGAPGGSEGSAERHRTEAPPSAPGAAPAKPPPIRIGRDPAPEPAALPPGALEGAIPYEGFRTCYTAAQEQDP